MLKVNNKIIRTRSGDFVVNFEPVSNLLLFLLLTSNK